MPKRTSIEQTLMLAQIGEAVVNAVRDSGALKVQRRAPRNSKKAAKKAEKAARKAAKKAKKQKPSADVE